MMGDFMKVAHVALWTRDLDESAEFWRRYFGGDIGLPYHSQRRPGFTSRFVKLAGDAQIELMTGSWIASGGQGERAGWDHVALSLGSERAVDELAELCRQDGILLSAPRLTGDGFYEAVIAAPDGTRIEITS
jgi:lactoylglutathione lyase